MKDFERPSILAVGMPEIFDLADAGIGDSASESSGGPESGLNGIGSGGRMSGRVLGPDAGLLQWMIYTSSKLETPIAAQLSNRLTPGLHLQQSRTASAVVDTSDDSAFGIQLDGESKASTTAEEIEVQTEFSATPDRAGHDLADSDSSEVSFIHAGSAKRAIELLRVLRFDLLVTSDQLPDMAMSQFIGRIRAVRPWQKWALVGSSNTPQTEITARSLGAAAVFDAPADLEVISELAQAVAARAPARMAVGATDTGQDSSPLSTSTRPTSRGITRKQAAKVSSVSRLGKSAQARNPGESRF